MQLTSFSFTFTAMASRCEVRVYAPDEATARAWSDAAIAEVQRIEAKYSRYRAESVVSAINRAAGVSPVDVDDETASLLDFGAQLYQQSDGLFDLSSGILRRAWDFKSARLPSQSAIDKLLPLVGWSKIRWKAREIFLPHAGMEIDFGGIGKEYAADRAAAAVADAGGQ
ncbi:MAG: FAD:protein FMN transferase, partial [Burkholderiaceae bacterium]